MCVRARTLNLGIVKGVPHGAIVRLVVALDNVTESVSPLRLRIGLAHDGGVPRLLIGPPHLDAVSYLVRGLWCANAVGA